MADGDFVVGYCGLCCSNCGAFRKGRCKGCRSERPRYRGCPVKACASGRGYGTCAECGDFGDLRGCGKLNNFVSRLFGRIFRTDRIGNLELLREAGRERFVQEKRASGKA